MSYQLGDKVRVIEDDLRGGRYVGRVGRIASNTLGGVVWVFLGPNYVNFYESGLEPAE